MGDYDLAANPASIHIFGVASRFFTVGFIDINQQPILTRPWTSSLRGQHICGVESIVPERPLPLHLPLDLRTKSQCSRGGPNPTQVQKQCIWGSRSANRPPTSDHSDTPPKGAFILKFHKRPKHTWHCASGVFYRTNASDVYHAHLATYAGHTQKMKPARFPWHILHFYTLLCGRFTTPNMHTHAHSHMHNAKCDSALSGIPLCIRP